jgi:hypothetical protein
MLSRPRTGHRDADLLRATGTRRIYFYLHATNECPFARDYRWPADTVTAVATSNNTMVSAAAQYSPAPISGCACRALA